MNLSTSGITFSAFSLIVLVFLGYCNEAFRLDCRHSCKSINSQAYCNVEIYSLLISYLNVLLYAFISSDNFLIYRLLLIIIHAIQAIMYFYYLPFYNFFANFLKSAIHVFILSSCIILLVGYVLNSAFFCVLAACVLIPLVLFIWYHALCYRVSFITMTDIVKIKNI